VTYAGWAIGMGRAAANELLTDTVTVTRVSGAPGPMDPETGEPSPAPTDTVYAGPGKVQTYEPYEATKTSAEHVYIEQRYQLHLPITAPRVDVGDTVTVTASQTDPLLIGKKYRVAGEHAKTWATSRRLLIDEVLA
jgi:hypothetical protein